MTVTQPIPPRRAKPRERGAALLIVLWMVLLLSLLAAAFVAESRSALSVGYNAAESARAEALADAGIARAVVAIDDPDRAFQWRADGTPYLWHFAGGATTVSIMDEGGKIDLNEAAPDVLASVFRHAGADGALSGRLADEVEAMRARGIEAVAAPPDGAVDPNAPPFAVIDDLSGLAGMTAQLFHAVEPLVTVYSKAATVNPLTASRDVLLSLPGGDPAEIDRFLAERGAYDIAHPELLAVPPSLARFLSVNNAVSAVTIRSDAVTAAGARYVREALIEMRDLRGVPFVVERWTEAIATR